MNQMTTIHDQILTHIQQNYPDGDISVLDVFYNPRRKGLRLTYFGCQELKKEYSSETFSLPKKEIRFNMQTILQLERKMKWPFFLNHTRSKITLFGDEDIIMFKLMGDAVSWIDSL